MPSWARWWGWNARSCLSWPNRISGSRPRGVALSFLVSFGLVKAGTNFFAGRLGDRYGRKPILVLGWLAAIPVPFLIMWAPSWGWIVAANVLLGINQGLAWSTTVIMMIDLAGPRKRGLAMGVNEFAGYVAVAGSALATGYIAQAFGLRPEPFYLGIAFAAVGLGLSAAFLRETRGHAEAEAGLAGDAGPAENAGAAGDAGGCRGCRDGGAGHSRSFGALPLEASRTLQRQPGGAGKQSERRSGLGAFPVVLCRVGTRFVRHRVAELRLSLHLGRSPVVDRRLVGPRGAQAVDRRGFADPGARIGSHRNDERVRRMARSGRAVGGRDGDGLPHSS